MKHVIITLVFLDSFPEEVVVEMNITTVVKSVRDAVKVAEQISISLILK
jgi:hypothetical protein